MRGMAASEKKLLSMTFRNYHHWEGATKDIT